MKLTPTQRERLCQTAKKGSVVLGVGLLYYFFVRLTGWRIPCLLTLFTGELCPGCGITRMFMALAELDFKRAFQCNMLVMGMLPFALAFGGRHWIRYIKTGENYTDRLEGVLIIVATVLTVLFWVLRNIPQFSFLTPI